MKVLLHNKSVLHADPHGDDHRLAEAQRQETFSWECHFLDHFLHYWSAALYHDVLS